MQLTGRITADNLMTLEAYTKWRKEHQPEVIAHRRLRSAVLGEHLHVQFESETTIRYQIQEMLRIEKVFEEEGNHNVVAEWQNWGKKLRLLQDIFLASTRKAGVQVTMFLVNGVMLQGRIAAYDLFCMLLEREGYVQLAYKHAVSTIQPVTPVDLTGDGWDDADEGEDD